MKRHLFSTVSLLVIFYSQSFAQYPPVIDNYSVSPGYNYVNLFLQFTPNDTGTIKIQVVMTQGTGNNVYDSTYSVPAIDSNGTTLYVGPLTPCFNFSVQVNLSSAQAQGPVYNPLTTVATTCTMGIEQIGEENFSMIVHQHSLELHCGEIPTGGNVEIYDLTGRKIVSTALGQSVQQIPFNVNAGVYLLRVTGSNQPLYTTRFVID